MAETQNTQPEAHPELYYYGGHCLTSGGKLGHVFYDLDGRAIYFGGRSFAFPIGWAFRVTRTASKIQYERAKGNPAAPDVWVNEWRIQSRANKTIYDGSQSTKRLATESKKLDDMTIGQIREYVKGNAHRKRTLRQYLDETLLW